MEMNDLVSIVVPVYNMGDSINVCVDSILKQDYPNIEILLVDDGSKDDSYAKCLAMAEKDSRVVVYHTENRGSGPARNYGIEHASGRYVYFPDADDYMEPNAISVMLQAMEGGKHDLVVFGYTTMGQNGETAFAKRYEEAVFDGAAAREDYAKHVGVKKPYGIQGAPWNKFFDMEVIRKNGIEYPPLRRHQDDGFIGRYVSHAKSIHFIPDALYIHYANDLRKEWQKYPVDYIDAIIGLYQTRKETILTWNENDRQTHAFIAREYITHAIKALELSFMPKMALTGKTRREWIMTNVPRCDLGSVTIPEDLTRYHRTVLKLLLRKKYALAIGVMHFKVMVEKAGLLDKIKKIIRH